MWPDGEPTKNAADFFDKANQARIDGDGFVAINLKAIIWSSGLGPWATESRDDEVNALDEYSSNTGAKYLANTGLEHLPQDTGHREPKEKRALAG